MTVMTIMTTTMMIESEDDDDDDDDDRWQGTEATKTATAR